MPYNIHFQDVTKKFADRAVLDQCALSIAAGDRIALLGQNGAGKTTLIRCLLKHYRYEGSITINDRAYTREQILSDVGFVPQHAPPIQMSVGELIRFHHDICGNSQWQRITDLGDKLQIDIEAERKKSFVSLSGGMKQKILICLALSKRPRLLILDEPTANLDPPARQAFLTCLEGAAKDSVMIISSHRVDEIRSLINRVVEMDCGRVVSDVSSALIGEPETPGSNRTKIRVQEKHRQARTTPLPFSLHHQGSPS